MESELFFEKIRASIVDISHGELFTAILKYCLENSLTLTAKINLCKMINSMFTYPVLPDTQYALDKILNPKKGAHFHSICHNCYRSLGEFGVTEIADLCPYCNEKVRAKSPSDESFFVIIDPSEQISDLLHMHAQHFDYVTKQREHESGYIKDVYDSKVSDH